jgi:hypothetical protein
MKQAVFGGKPEAQVVGWQVAPSPAYGAQTVPCGQTLPQMPQLFWSTSSLQVPSQHQAVSIALGFGRQAAIGAAPAQFV